MFFGYGVVICIHRLRSEKELLNLPFRGKLQTREPLPSGLLNPAGSGLTTESATVRRGMRGHAVVKAAQIVLNAEFSALDRVGNERKKFSQSVHTQEVTGSSPVIPTKALEL